MRKTFVPFVLLFNFAAVQAQQDSIFINAKINRNLAEIAVNQEITFTNTSVGALSNIQLLNWIAAYKNSGTALALRKLEDQKTDLHFAKNEELGRLEDLEIKFNNTLLPHSSISEENIEVQLPKTLEIGEKITLNLSYHLHLPSQKFTGYGFGNGETNLKYFFLVPDGRRSESAMPKNFLDIGERQSAGNYWKVILDVPADFNSQSNLNEIHSNYFEGVLQDDPEFLVSGIKNDQITAIANGKTVVVDFGYNLTSEEKQELEYYLPLHLSFIDDKIGFLPQKIFISDKFKRKENFSGINDIKFWKFRFQYFPHAQQTDLNYFSIISQNVVNQSLVFNKSRDHWMPNGLKTYLEIQYLNRFYEDAKLLGNLPENVRLFGIKPLKIFHAADLKLSTRYGLSYQYIMTQNLDQRIATPFEKLSNYNATAISQFETGGLFSFLAEKMGTDNFDNFIKNYLQKNKDKSIDTQEFLDGFTVASGYSAAFMEEFIQRKNRVNFKLKRFTRAEDEFRLKIAKNSRLQIPFKVETEKSDGTREQFWFDTTQSTEAVIYNIPNDAADKIIINDEYIFPERNFRDNYLYTKGVFANTKRAKLKLFTDIPDPEYNEIYLSPRLNFNVYDKILLGINIKNTSLYARHFSYSVSPYFSTGTGKLTGSGAVAYSFHPANSFIRSLDFGVSGSYFHYDYDLTYRRISLTSAINFSKIPRSEIGRTLSFSYNFYEKDLDPKIAEITDYQKYNLWNIGYSYVNNHIIHEKALAANAQFMEDFQKISAEAFYRWQFGQNKKISFRFFAGMFLSNTTKNDLFDFGVSRVSNYAFSYGLLGQSATTGLFSQQLIIAEGGFKSLLADKANQWITSVNVDSHLWKLFNVYADAGVYKSKFYNPEFIWDSGIKLKIVPDFLEIYFPVQSSLGFEPGFKDYSKRIRFTLTLNFAAIRNHFRRGKF